MTWAWNLANGERTAWRQRLCPGCFAQLVLALPMLTPEQPLTCPGCGAGTQADMDPLFGTAFLPGMGRMDFEWPTCAPCAVEFRNRAQTGAEHLENRTNSSGAWTQAPEQTNPPSGLDHWNSLGLGANRFTR